MSPPKIPKSILRRVFTLQFIRKLILYGFGGFVFILGVFFLLRFVPEKAFEFSSPYFGTIKTTAITASNYLAEIETIRQRVEGQRDTIDAAFANAATAQRAASNATEQVVHAREQLGKMETNAAILQLVARAYGDDRKAFDQLLAIGNQASNHSSDFAIGVINTLIELHDVEVAPPPRDFPPGLSRNGKELTENEITLDEVRSVFPKVGLGYRPQFLHWFSYSSRFKRLEKLEFLLEVRRTDESLIMCRWAVKEFFRLADMHDLKPLHHEVVPMMEEWLRRNRANVKD